MTLSNEIKTWLHKTNELAPSGFVIAFHLRLNFPDFIFQNYPKNWSVLYSEKGYLMIDPAVRWGNSNIGYKRWSELKEPAAEQFWQHAESFGLKYGVTVATCDGNSRTIGGFARPDREFKNDEIDTLQQYVSALHDLTNVSGEKVALLRKAMHKFSTEIPRTEIPA